MMFEIPHTILENVIAPLAAAQLFLTILVYFTIVRKRMAADYKLYVYFLATFIFFLVGRSLQQFAEKPLFHWIHYSRMALLYAVGIPSLMIAAALQAGFKRRLRLFIWPYAIGALLGIGYVICTDAWMIRALWTEQWLRPIPFDVRRHLGELIQAVGAVVMLVLPCIYLMIREFCSGRNRNLLAFLSGALWFGVLMVIGCFGQNIELYYLGSVVSALCWGWAVFQDIRDLRGRVALLKEELYLLVCAGGDSVEPKVEKLLANLEQLSAGNLDVYKMRIRDILGTLTEATIQAGGDTDTLVRRNADRTQAIEASQDSDSIRAIIRSEAVELSGLIAEIPVQQNNRLIEQAKAFVEAHYSRDLAVGDIAESSGVSQAHLMREFKKETGRTVNQYVTGLRIEKAKELLAEKTVTETAFEVGYNNSNYFNTVFKKQTGITPGQFKASRRSELNALKIKGDGS